MPSNRSLTVPSRSTGRGLAYTVEVVDKTGKAIHTSKTLFDAIREARDAYRMKKAMKKEERARRASAEAERIDQERRQHQHRHRGERERRSDDEGEHRRRRMHSDRPKRRATAGDMMSHSNVSSVSLATTVSEPETVDEPEAGAGPGTALQTKDDHLTALFMQCNDIFDSLSAFQFSITTLVGALQRDPETLAVVGLTLAEISSLITKLSPAMLATLKTTWPMVFAFLSSPQFAILAGVGIGTTVVLVGGFKIVKKLLAAKEPPELVEMGGRVVGEIEVRELPAPQPAQPAQPAATAPTTSAPSRSTTRASSSSKSSKSKRRDDLAFPPRKSSTKDDLAFGDATSPDSPPPEYTYSRKPSQDKKLDLAFDIPRKSKSKSSSSKVGSSSSGEKKKSSSGKERVHTSHRVRV